MLLMSCGCHAFASVQWFLVVPCWKRVNLLSLVCGVYCGFVTFPGGILDQVWNLIVSIPDHCCLSYVYNRCKQTLASLPCFGHKGCPTLQLY